MRLLIMRHGIATPLDEHIKDDAQRPLTADGRDKTWRAVAGLRAAGESPNLIATSPLLRAVETAQLAHKVYGDKPKAPRLEIWPELEHAEAAAMWRRLKRESSGATILVVGHEPGLSRLVVAALTGSPTGFTLDFKKAAVCALDISFRGDAAPQAILLWHVAPRLLRLMAA